MNRSALFFCLLITILIHPNISKKINKAVNLNSLKMLPGTVFLTKFDIGAGKGSFSIKYEKTSSHVDLSNLSVKLGILKDQSYKKFRSSQTCQQKQSLFFLQQVINLAQQKSWGVTHFNIQEQTQQHIWYLYIFDCNPNSDRDKLNGMINIEVIMLNNGSYFGEDQNLLPGYVIIFVIWVVLGIKMFWPIVVSLDKNIVSWHQIFIYAGFLMLGLAYLYRLVDLILIHIYNSETYILLYLYKFIKYVIQGVMVTVITSIGWGWSLTHFKQEPYYIIAGTVISIINFMAMILQTSVSQLEQSHHQYESILGFALFLIRIIIFIVFIVGIFRCMTLSVGKRRHFLKKFGRQGTAYFLAWPLAVIFVEIFLPNYMHNQVVTIVQQCTHIFVSAHMCHLFAFPDTDFQKVSLKDQEDMMPDYKINK